MHRWIYRQIDIDRYRYIKIFGSITKRTYDCVLPSGTIFLYCHSSIFKYLIKCNCCYL